MGDLLERYAARTVLPPRPDWVYQVHTLIAKEAALTPSRRFVLALAALAPRDAVMAVRQSVGAVLGRGAFPGIVRAQALAVVLLVALSVGVMGAGGAIVLQAVLPPAEKPSPTHTTPNDASPTARPDDRKTPEPADPADVAQPSPGTDSGAGGPSVDDARESQPTPRSDDATKPHPTPKPEKKPHPTQKPHPTPKPEKKPHATQKPHPTPKPRPTPRPQPTPRSDNAQKPRPTPRSDNAQKPHPTPKGSKSRQPRSTPRNGKPQGAGSLAGVASAPTLEGPGSIG